ncbi:MAG: SDR family oxidoreductase [Gammaproteobacteria bacterium]|nr:SDR family oxidoreductase [Gammaproteobacteria bacterium]
MNNILIVGATSGVGECIANRLQDTHVVYTASRGTNARHSSKHAAWNAVQEAFPEDFLPQRLDGLVYCPGSINLQPFERLSEDSFREDFEINLLGAVRVLKASLPALKAAPMASVVLFSSVAVATGMPMHASIAAAKGAVEGLTRSLAAELAPKIRVNAIAPSLTETPLSAKLLRTERQRIAAAERHPLGKIGKINDLAAAANFLLSSEADWITGQVLPIDGGIGSIRKFN